MRKGLILLFLTIVVLAAFGADLLLRRGFRANAPVPPWEAKVARGVRNLSIPGEQRYKQNPVAASPTLLQEGRDSFLSHCAACHGVDGSGKTPVGSNLYPRVPDLRSSLTQRLTAGDIHYIIENGVQLTGMPAWNKSGSEDDIWKLVLFVRSLGPLSPKEREQQSAMMASARYTGSQSCEKCHQEIYARWKKTPMANVVRDPREHPGAITPDLTTNNVAKFTNDQVAFVYGSLWKQRYFTKVGDDYFPLAVQWDFADHSWRPYHVPDKGGDWWTAFYPSDNMQRPTGPTCDGCHSVGYDIHTKQVAEWNVGCERCHGPGSEHVAHPSRSNIVNPGLMDSVAASDTCIQCHSQGQPRSSPIEGKYYDWPVGYSVGLKLADYWRLEDCTLGQTTFYYFQDCTAHKNRMQGNDFAQSVMYRRGITCSSCHDVHGTANYAQLRKPAEQICLDCHGPSSPNGPHTATLEAHTHHKEGGPGSQCVACHMPAIESEGVPGTFVHAHTFRFISPEMTDKYGIPNPCTSCHKDKNTAWAREAMSKWPEFSSWMPGN
jgi:predicted CXXCH cytochrome family protein